MTADAEVQHGQHADAAEAVGEVAADGPQERAGDDAGGGERSRRSTGVDGRIGSVKKLLRKTGQADEAAEGDGVKQAEPPGVGWPSTSA